MSGYFALEARPLSADDAQGARVLLMAALGVTPYLDRAMEVLTAVERGHGTEYAALVIARDGTVAALALYGPIAGTEGGVRLHALAISPGVGGDVGARIIEALMDASRTLGARFVLAEMADDPALHGAIAELTSNGFQEEARVSDFFREGVALSFLRRAV